MSSQMNGSKYPVYLDTKFFQTALENGLREPLIRVNNFKFADGCGGGENYCSNIYRITVDFQRDGSGPLESIPLIVKSMPQTPVTEFLDEMRVYLKEVIFYQDILPRLEILLDDGHLGAKYIYATSSPVKTIVFEDLTPQGYTLANRQTGLDEIHCKVLLEKLGQLHATSMIIAKKDADITRHFQKGMLHNENLSNPEIVTVFNKRQVTILAETVAEWPGFEEISKKLMKYSEDIRKHQNAAGEPIYNEIKVLNHGDLWVNNFLFKYNAEAPETPVDVKLVDFQVPFYCSPGCDLNFFLNSSVQLDVLIEKRDVLIETYYNSFSSTLRRLNQKHIPTLEDIKQEVANRERYGLFSAYSFLPVISMHKADSADNNFENMFDEEFAKKKIKIALHSNERTLKTLRYSLKRFDELGVLD